MQIAAGWLTYVLIVLGVYLLLTFCNCRLNWDNLTRLLVAFLVGFVAVLFIIPNIEIGLGGNRSWSTLLLLAALIIPAALALWMAWQRKMIPGLSKEDVVEADADGFRTTRDYECDDESCKIVRETRVGPGERSNFTYRNRRRDVDQE